MLNKVIKWGIALDAVLIAVAAVMILTADPAEVWGAYTRDIDQHLESIDEQLIDINAHIYEDEAEEAEAVIEGLDTIERIVMAEARGEGFEGMAAVAQTIKDRGDLWGISYIEAATAPGQYAEPFDGAVSAECRRACRSVFFEGLRVIEEPTTHFYAYEQMDAPYWTAGAACRGTIGGHRFYEVI